MFLYRMARYGVQTLLCKYNNPTLRSRRILINSKSYYHPYKMMYHNTDDNWRNIATLWNITEVGDIKLNLVRNSRNLVFSCYYKKHNVIFIHMSDNSMLIIINGDDKLLGTWIARHSCNTKFKISGDPKFLALANKITETTIAEIYRNHLPTILNLIEI